jgi:cysteine desulfurase/selenocysteine lyase
MLTEATRRRDFPSLEGRTYLNTAAEGIPSLAVREALAQYFRDKERGMDGRKPHIATWEAARTLTGQMFGLSMEEVGICSCTSEAFNLAALALRLKPGDEIVINDLDFPAGRTPWIQESCPATVKVWRARDNALRVEDLIPLLSPRTRLVTSSLVSFFNGFKIPLPAIVEAVRKHSPARISLDVTQALGRIPLDLTGVDLIVSSTHKWILASHGGGLVGVPRERAQEWTVPVGGWYNLDAPFDPDRLLTAAPKQGAASFMVGMPNYAAIYCIRAALDYIQSVGVGNIEKAARPLTLHCVEELAKLPIDLITPREPESLAGIVSFHHAAFEQIAAALHAENIHVMCQARRIRVSIHGYNTPADVERFLQQLRRALGKIGASH